MNFKKKPIIGMIHLSGGLDLMVPRALAEIDIFVEEGIDACILENYHGDIFGVEATLEALSKLPKKNIEYGINILPNDFERAIEIAVEYGCTFIQLDYIAGNYVRSGGLNVSKFLDVINKFPMIQVLGGVWPKYYQPVEGSVLATDLKQGCDLANAIVVTGTGTGKETPLDKIKEFKTIIGEHPLIIGAGLDTSNVAEQLPFADGAIVGSCFKPYKRTQEMISRELVKEFMTEVKKIR
jgi:predicted TIM-barrel enzyme